MPVAPSAEASTPSRSRGSLAPLVFAAIVGLAVGDAFRPPERQAIARVAVASIDVYRSAISPRLAATGLVRCKFTPSCSAYGREAIVRYGTPKGFVLAAGRVLRCHPWAEGGADPVP